MSNRTRTPSSQASLDETEAVLREMLWRMDVLGVGPRARQTPAERRRIARRIDDDPGYRRSRLRLQRKELGPED